MRAIRQPAQQQTSPECSWQSKLMALAINFNVGAHQIVFLRSTWGQEAAGRVRFRSSW